MKDHMSHEEIARVLRSQGCSTKEIDAALDFLTEHEQTETDGREAQ